MDGFKQLPKMQCFKENGAVKTKKMCYGGKAMKKGGEVSKSDMEQDKKLIKKAFKQHDEAEHDKEPTEIKLKKGGRAKKEMGTVRKYKDGGAVGVYGAKKKSGDLDSIEKAKDIKPAKAAAPSRASEKPAFKGSDVSTEKSKPAGHKDPYIKSKESGKAAAAPSGAKGGPNKYKKGGGVKKFAAGDSTGTPSFQKDPYAAQDALDRQDNMATREMIAGPARRLKNYIAGKLSGLSPMNAAVSGVGAPNPAQFAPQPQQQQAAPTMQPAMPAQKRGGKVKKAC